VVAKDDHLIVRVHQKLHFSSDLLLHNKQQQTMPNGDDDDNNHGKYFSDTSSSIDTIDHDEEKRRREKRRKKSKKSSRRDESESEQRKDYRHSGSNRDKKKRRKKSDKKKRNKDRKRHKRYDGDSSSDSRSYDENDSIDSRRRRKKHSRKERKRRRKESPEDGSDKRKSKSAVEIGATESTLSGSTRGQTVAKALHCLLKNKPDFASELPLILIRIAGGTTFDLSQVMDTDIATGLQAVFEALESFGVKKQESSGVWMFQNPPGASRLDELVLLKVIRSFLDEVGLTMDKVLSFDAKKQTSEQRQAQQAVVVSDTIEQEERQKMKELTFKILEKFQSKDATLGSQLAGLCVTIADGESVCLDGIPDEGLRTSLEFLFQSCGLEKSEIEDDAEEEVNDEEDSDESQLMGYGLPSDDNIDSNAVQIKLATIMAACREGPPKRKSIGPMKRPTTAEEEQTANAIYGANNAQTADESEDEGPLLPGEARNTRKSIISHDEIKAQAEYRELELKSTAAGVPMPAQNGGREEWMINPGQHDFLAGVKSGQSIKGRGFQNKKSRGNDVPAPVHPAVQAEMNAIMQAHESARGPSLIDLHQSKISQEKELAANNRKGKKEWKWSRNKDLDAGRRVDKDALGMILGGAADELKSKFSGGFNR